jgi:hypothetical protein
MIKNDSNVDMSNLAEESINVINLHSKYLGLWSEEKRVLNALDSLLKKKKLEKINYYLGRSSNEEYLDKPLNLRIPRQDLDFYLDGDEELIDLKDKFIRQQDKCSILKQFIEQNILQRSYNIKNAISFLNWTAGK